MRKGAAILAAALLSGCAARRIEPNRITSAGILERTGKAIAPPEAKGGLPPGVSLDAPLTSDDAAGIAIWNNAQLRADLAAAGLAEGDLIDAGLMRNPRLDLLVPIGAKPFELLFNFPVEAFIQRPRRIAAAQAALDQLSESLIQNGLNTARDARWAHADLIQATARVEQAKRSVDLRERVAAITQARLRAGDISELETITARSELGVAREQLAGFQHDVKIAEERLRAALGLATERPELRATATAPSLDPPPPIEALLARAMESRPDLRAAEMGIAAATKRANWERSRVLWLTAQLSSKDVGTNGILTGPGASIEFPLFNRNQGLIHRADADVQAQSLAYLAIKQRVALEVAEARAQLVRAQESLQRLRDDVLPPLQRAVAVAEEQYQTGDVAFLFVLEQTRGLVDAQLRVIDADTAIRRAQAQLERSVGSK